MALVHPIFVLNRVERCTYGETGIEFTPTGAAEETARNARRGLGTLEGALSGQATCGFCSGTSREGIRGDSS